jgi:MFS family permease
VKGLAAVSFWNDVASEMVLPLLPALVTGTLGGGATALAAVEGASDVAASALKWASGRLSDRRGWRRPLILAGYATAILVRPVLALSSSVGQVIALRVVDRAGKGLRTAPRDALIADVTPARLHGRAFGLHRGLDHLGAVAGSVVAWWLLTGGMAVRDVIGWSIAPGLVALVVVSVVLKTGDGGGRNERPTPAAKNSGRGGRTLGVALLALAGLALARVPELLLLLRVQELGVALATIPLLWGALHVVRSVASYPGGWLTDTIGPRKTVAAGAALFALVAFGLSRALSPAGAALVFLGLGGVAGLTESAERALVARLSPVARGRGFGAYSAITGLAALPAALLFGWVYETRGGGAAMAASALATVVAAGIWVATARSEK